MVTPVELLIYRATEPKDGPIDAQVNGNELTTICNTRATVQTVTRDIPDNVGMEQDPGLIPNNDNSPIFCPIDIVSTTMANLNSDNKPSLVTPNPVIGVPGESHDGLIDKSNLSAVVTLVGLLIYFATEPQDGPIDVQGNGNKLATICDTQASVQTVTRDIPDNGGMEQDPVLIVPGLDSDNSNIAVTRRTINHTHSYFLGSCVP